ncbi:hypothetical protein AB0D67_38305 [Streptosporangium sp. NPDC048047]|uniref:hypothetical protein n=1 Tax=Streptosporangium sp. NPDC048047 TaxID=3155748 RepID=UPI00343ED77A
MNWHERLRDRLASPENGLPYQMAVAREGHPLSSGRQVYALADVLGVDPGDLMVDLRKQCADEQSVQETVKQLVAAVESRLELPPAS